MDYSIIFIFDKIRENFISYVQAVDSVFHDLNEGYEIIIVANGTDWFLNREIEKSKEIPENLKIVSFRRPTSSAVCIKTALRESSGERIFICGAYQQISKESIKEMVHALDDDIDIVSPWRNNRMDPRINQLQSKVFNNLIRKLTNSKLHDHSIPEKLYRREVLENLDIYGNMSNYITILALQKGYRVREVNCDHFQAQGATGVYRISEYANRIIDVFTIYYNINFNKMPFRFFSAFGALFIGFGFLISLYSLIDRFVFNRLLGDRPLLLIAIILMVIGVQAASFGLLGEIIAFVYGRKRTEYTIDKVI